MWCYEDSDMDMDLNPMILNDSSQCNCSIEQHVFEQAICTDICPIPTEMYDLSIPVGEILPIAMIYSIVFLVGSIGNLLVIFVVANFKRMWNVTNLFLASLSLVDLCLLFFCIPVQFLKFVSFSWSGGMFLCYSVHYIQGFTQICSVLTLTVMSLERYFAILHPLKAMWCRSIGRAKKIIVAIWIASALIAIPNAYGTQYEVTEDIRLNWTANLCLRNGRPSFQTAFGVYQFMTVLFLPLVTMVFCYATIANKLCIRPTLQRLRGKKKPGKRKIKKKDKSGVVRLLIMSTDLARPLIRNGAIDEFPTEALRRTNVDKEMKTKRQIVAMLMFVVFLFTICWTPFIIDDLLVGFGVVCGQAQTTWLKYLSMACAIMAYANSCVNPIVYAFMSSNFRATFRGSFRRMVERWEATAIPVTTDAGPGTTLYRSDFSAVSMFFLRQTGILPQSKSNMGQASLHPRHKDSVVGMGMASSNSCRTFHNSSSTIDLHNSRITTIDTSAEISRIEDDITPMDNEPRKLACAPIVTQHRPAVHTASNRSGYLHPASAVRTNRRLSTVSFAE